MSIEERLCSLERSNSLLVGKIRRLRLVLLVLIVCAAGAATLAMTPGETKEYSVFDASGKERARLGMVGEGSAPGIVFLTKKGSKRLFVGLDSKESPVITFLGKSGQSAYYIDVNGSGKGEPGSAIKKASIVCFTRADKDKVFHRCAQKGESRCSEMSEGFPKMLPIGDARKKGMRPCPVCFPDSD